MRVKAFVHSQGTHRGDALETSSKDKARLVLRVILFVLFSVAMTLAGAYFTLRQFNSPDWTGVLAAVILLPSGIVNWIFHWINGPGLFSPPMYRAASLLGLLAQLLYYLAIFTFIRRLFSMLKRRLGSSVNEGERQ